MDTSLSTSIFLGFVFTFFALLVQSQPQNNPVQPPPLLVPTPSPSPLPPPPSPSPSPPPPPAGKSHGKASGGARNAYRGGGKHHPPPPHPPRKLHNQKMNAGKKIGLLFVGIAVILQIGVVGFLVFRRRQLLKIKDRYETCSS